MQIDFEAMLKAVLCFADTDPARNLLGTAGYNLPACNGLSPINLSGDNNYAYTDGIFNGFRFDISPYSKNNIIVIENNSTCAGNIIIRGSDNFVIVRGSKEGRNPINIHIFSDNCLFFWGDECTSNTATFEISGSGRSIIVAEDCMFSAFIDVTTDDRHVIFDYESGDYINPASSVHFAPHVWVGLHASIMKGVSIGFGSIVAARTVVSRSVPELSIFGGIPGRIIKSGVSWIRNRDPNVNAVIKVKDLHKSVQNTFIDSNI